MLIRCDSKKTGRPHPWLCCIVDYFWFSWFLLVGYSCDNGIGIPCDLCRIYNIHRLAPCRRVWTNSFPLQLIVS